MTNDIDKLSSGFAIASDTIGKFALGMALMEYIGIGIQGAPELHPYFRQFYDKPYDYLANISYSIDKFESHRTGRSGKVAIYARLPEFSDKFKFYTEQDMTNMPASVKVRLNGYTASKYKGITRNDIAMRWMTRYGLWLANDINDIISSKSTPFAVSCTNAIDASKAMLKLASNSISDQSMTFEKLMQMYCDLESSNGHVIICYDTRNLTYIMSGTDDAMPIVPIVDSSYLIAEPTKLLDDSIANSSVSSEVLYWHNVYKDLKIKEARAMADIKSKASPANVDFVQVVDENAKPVKTKITVSSASTEYVNMQNDEPVAKITVNPEMRDKHFALFQSALQGLMANPAMLNLSKDAVSGDDLVGHAMDYANTAFELWTKEILGK